MESHWQSLQTSHLVQGSSSADYYIAPFLIFQCLAFAYLLILFYNNYLRILLIIYFLIFYICNLQHGGNTRADSGFKDCSIFRELWSNGPPVLISRLIYQMDYAELGALVLSEGRETRAVFLTQTFYIVNGYQQSERKKAERKQQRLLLYKPYLYFRTTTLACIICYFLAQEVEIHVLPCM